MHHHIAPMLLLLVLATPGRASGDWERIGQADGITISRRVVPDSELIAFRGVAMVEAPIGTVTAVVEDTPRYTDWIHDLTESRTVREVSATERVLYMRMATPWPLEDRVFVVSASVRVDRALRRITFSMSSADEPSVPVTDGLVRARMISGSFELTAVGQGRTQVVVEIHADPAGKVPTWLVNTVQKEWPMDTLRRLRAQVARPDVRVSEGAAALVAALN